MKRFVQISLLGVLFLSTNAFCYSRIAYHCDERTREFYASGPERPFLVTSFVAMAGAWITQAIDTAVTDKLSDDAKKSKYIAPGIAAIYGYVAGPAAVPPYCDPSLDTNPSHTLEFPADPESVYRKRVRSALILSGVNTSLQTWMLFNAKETWGRAIIGASIAAPIVVALIYRDHFSYKAAESTHTAINVEPVLFSPGLGKSPALGLMAKLAF